MNAYILPDGTISFTDLNINQAKLIQQAVRRLLHIENKLNPLYDYSNSQLLAIVDDICSNYGPHTKNLKIISHGI